MQLTIYILQLYYWQTLIHNICRISINYMLISNNKESSLSPLKYDVPSKITIEFEMIIFEFWYIGDFKSYITFGRTQGRL